CSSDLVVQYAPHLLPHINPDRMDIAGCVSWTFPVVDNTPVGDDRTFDRLDHFKQRDLVRRTAENESSAGAAVRFDQTDFAELLEYFCKKCRGDIYGCSDVAQQADLFGGAGCQENDPANCVFTLAGKLHHLKNPWP